MDFNNNQNEPQNTESSINNQEKKGTFFKKKIIYGFFMFLILLIIFLIFRKEIFSSDDKNQKNKKIIKNNIVKDVENPNLENAQYGEDEMQDLSYDENGGLTEEELNYVIPGEDEENQNNIEPQKSTEEIERENRLKQLQSESDAAFRSPTTITIATRPQTQQVDNNVLLAKGEAKPVQDYDGNRQESKKNFLMNEQAQRFYQTNFLVEQLSEFELKSGDFIPATLQTGINSDLPSKVIVAIVSENVRDTISGKHILIPQGTRVIGTYDSSVTFGQERLLVVWQRLIFPNGKSIGLDNMQGVDLSGKAGITGEIDNHFSTLLKGVVLSSIMGSAAAIVTDRKNDWRGAAAEGAGEQIVTIGERFADRALSRQPTINIEPGARLNIMVHSDLILEPYGE